LSFLKGANGAPPTAAPLDMVGWDAAVDPPVAGLVMVHHFYKAAKLDVAADFTPVFYLHWPLPGKIGRWSERECAMALYSLSGATT